MRKTILAGLLATSSVTAMLYAPAAQAQTAERRYDIAAQPLSSALQRYSEISGRQVIADGTLLAGKRSNRVAGSFSADTALSRLLAGSGLTAELVDGALVLRPGNGDAAEAGSTDAVGDGDAILVVVAPRPADRGASARHHRTALDSYEARATDVEVEVVVLIGQVAVGHEQVEESVVVEIDPRAAAAFERIVDHGVPGIYDARECLRRE